MTALQHVVNDANDRAEAHIADTTPDERKELGQFFTDPAVAAFMADLLIERGRPDHPVVLDPGAGTGTLGLALATRLIESGVRDVTLVAVEVDPATSVRLRDSLTSAARRLDGRLHVDVRVGDFLEAAEGRLGLAALPACDFVIANPPYFKVTPGSGSGGDAPNIYARFMEMSARLLRPGGRMAFIVPRSYASGFYFKRFRRHFHAEMQLEHVHVFESRRDAFREQGVLQENIIVVYRRASRAAAASITVSTSGGRRDLSRTTRVCVPYKAVMRPGDQHAVLHLPTSEGDLRTLERLHAWGTRLRDLGLDISTGPVVAFRARDYLLNTPDGTPAVPLVWLNHVRMSEVVWPMNGRFRKQQYIRSDAPPALLVPNRNYVLTRRFSAKEEERRLTVAPLFAGRLPGDYLGLENHVNFIHRPNGVMTDVETAALSALLGSRLYDAFFRISSGNTQVSATEIRSLPLPNSAVLHALGEGALAQPLCANVAETVIAEELV